ncbi:MAG: transposase, partial [Proteobacteria bacterium]|nr:transposase [Pseudomonadota bacterium]
HAMVWIEDLQVRAMSPSAAGAAERPGRNVRAKSGLNKSILDQGWAEFHRQLEYKLARRGVQKLRDEGQDTAHACAGRTSAARIACEVSGAVRRPAAETRRSDSGVAACHA